MHHPDIDAWLSSRMEREKLDELERKAADAWYAMLSRMQREAFALLLTQGYEGLSHLRRRVLEDEHKELSRRGSEAR